MLKQLIPPVTPNEQKLLRAAGLLLSVCPPVFAMMFAWFVLSTYPESVSGQTSPLAVFFIIAWQVFSTAAPVTFPLTLGGVVMWLWSRFASIKDAASTPF